MSHRVRLAVLWLGVGLVGSLAASPPADAAPRKFFGVDAWGGYPPSAAKFKRLGEGCVGTARIQFYWPQIEPAKGVFDWAAYDSIVSDAVAAHVRILPVLFGTPGWLSPRAENPPLGTQEARAGWRRFVKEAVRRYGPNGLFWQANPTLPNLPIRAWEVWNEESSPTFWYQRVSAHAYARLLRIAHGAARDVDPKATIVVGGIFLYPNRKGAIPWKRYLRDLYGEWHVRRNFEGVAIHPYTPNWHWTEDVMRQTRVLMDNHGDARTGLWITEFGWSSGGNPSAYTRTPQGQAYQLRHVYRMLLGHRRGWLLRSVDWFVWGDRPRQQGEPDWWGLHSGLFNVNGGAKPAWSAYAHVAGGTP
jgi:hypothetical protein